MYISCVNNIQKAAALTRLYFSISRIAQVDLSEDNTERACCLLKDLVDDQIDQYDEGVEAASQAIIGDISR